MPELPEVETTRRGIEPHVLRRQVKSVILRQPLLRWPIPSELPTLLKGRTVLEVGRRGKYLLIRFRHGHLLIHLGMSGSLRILDAASPPQKHDHFDLCLDDGHCLRLRDPRRFGAVLWTEGPAAEHPLLAALGPEPLGDDFTGNHLHRLGSVRRSAVKTLIMDSRVVVGVGNIYASESLFRAGIHPSRASNRISSARYQALAAAIREVLAEAIAQGGTTLRDFQREDGRPGYFSQQLKVYGRAGAPCPVCETPVQTRVIGQRSSYFCRRCQH